MTFPYLTFEGADLLGPFAIGHTHLILHLSFIVQETLHFFEVSLKGSAILQFQFVLSLSLGMTGHRGLDE